MSWVLAIFLAHASSLRTLSFEAFDQALPSGGWRGIADPREAARVIDDYVEANSAKLTPGQRRLLEWHAGQSLAMAGETKAAVDHLERALDPDETPANTFKWNAYARGTIAFLNGDRKGLTDALKEIRRASDPHAAVNVKILENFARCPTASYGRAYAGCVP